MRLVRFAIAALVLLQSLSLARPAHAVPLDPAGARHREVVERTEEAARLFARRSVEGRRAAIADLERATVLEPDNLESQMLLARVYYAAGFLHSARQRFEKVASLVPDDADAQFGLAAIWRKDYLKYLDPTSLARAIEYGQAALRDDPSRVDAWTMLASLRLEQKRVPAALAAAQGAVGANAASPDAWLALAMMRWNTGDPAGADSAFRVALPGLPRPVRERFDDIAPLVDEADTLVYNHLDAAGKTEWSRRFWSRSDPDLATTENEAQLEYWSRVAQAYFLFYDPKHREWDERGEIWVRYGPPEKATYNPLGASMYSSSSVNSRFAFPVNVLSWEYPKLGMTVTLQDRVLSQYYLVERSMDHDTDPRPDPAALAALDGVPTASHRGVFPVRPVGVQRLNVDASLAAFPGGTSPRIVAAIQAAGTPGDSLWAECVVLDSTARPVLHTRTTPSPSACAADQFRVADFAATLPPGDYTVGMTLGRRGARGTFRRALHLGGPDSTLALSDIVVTCGTPAIGGSSVRLDPNPTARVPAHEPLTAYFEIAHLVPGDDGQSHFAYDYRVHSADVDRRIWLQRTLQPRAAGPEIEAQRHEDFTGTLRRQFLSVPLQSLPPGRYRLDVTVRDLVTNAETTGFAEFTREAEPGR